GTHEELLLQKGLYYAMWRQQVGERRELPVENEAGNEDDEDGFE
ncbi:MAG: hypothetical protein JWR72_3391, partial [Flavisolibacter sp.]|nr:hypothetical protein [Flavisolibacter sp.]